MRKGRHDNCKVVGCTNQHKCRHVLPADGDLRTQWLNFIYDGDVPESLPKVVTICANHFEPGSYLNIGAYNGGFVQLLRLKPGSVPTIRTQQRVFPSGSSPAITQDENSSDPKASRLNVIKVEVKEEKCLQIGSQSIQQRTLTTEKQTGSQMEPAPNTVSSVSLGTQFSPVVYAAGTVMTPCPSRKSVATQLSYSTLRHPIKSRATQTGVALHNAGTQTVHRALSDRGLHFFITHVQKVRPTKRPRQEDKEYGQTIVPLKHGSSHQPADSETEPSEISGMEWDVDCNDKLSVSVLKDLFLTCPKCKKDCEMQRNKQEKYEAFIQRCHNCQYTRKMAWNVC